MATYRANISELNGLISRGIRRVLSEGEEFNVRGVYHVSPKAFDRFEKTNFNYFFFSSKPIMLGDARYTYMCNLSIHKPFVFSCGTSWSYPLWLYLSDNSGQLIPEEKFTRERYDGYLGCPYEFWKVVYYDDFEYEVDQVPDIVRQIGIDCDGIIIKDVDEGDSSINVDDYIVFDPSQIQIVRRS